MRKSLLKTLLYSELKISIEKKLCATKIEYIYDTYKVYSIRKRALPSKKSFCFS